MSPLRTIVPKRKCKKDGKNNIPQDRQKLMRRRRRINKMLSKITSGKRAEKFRSELVQIELALKKSLNQQAMTEEHKAMKSIKRNSK